MTKSINKEQNNYTSISGETCGAQEGNRERWIHSNHARHTIQYVKQIQDQQKQVCCSIAQLLEQNKQQESVQAPCLYASISLLIKTVRRNQLMGALHIPPYF